MPNEDEITQQPFMRVLMFQALQDETESLWSEYELQCSQCSQINERTVEQDRAELTVKWREQRAQLQRRYAQKNSAHADLIIISSCDLRRTSVETISQVL